MSNADAFVALIGPVATRLFGAPNKAMSNANELRFGKRGSLSVDLQKGAWFWHGEGKQGGVLDLIAEKEGTDRKGAIDWLKANGFNVPEGDRPARAGNGGAHGGNDRSSDQPRPQIVKTYPYVDERGELIFEVVRMEPKDFRQRRKARADDPPDRVRNGWVWSVKGCRQVPYRLPELIAAIRDRQTIFVVEGEKDADNLWSKGVPATCNAQGAGKWPAEMNSFFVDCDIVILPDNDPQSKNQDGSLRYHPDGRPVFPGQDHAELVGGALASVARDVRVLELPGLPPKGDASDWIAAGGTADQLYELLDTSAQDFTTWCMGRPGPVAPFDQGTAPIDPAAPFISKFHARPWAHLDDQAEKHEWLIKGVVTRGEVAMMAGPSGCGKSFLGLDLAMSICRGDRWFGNWVRQGGVIYQAGEGKRGLFKRLKAYRKENRIDLAYPLDFVLMPAGLNLYSSDDHAKAFIAECNYWRQTFRLPLELVVIDTFGAATSGADENASRDMGPVLERCARIAAETKSAVLLVHHMNAGGTKARGWTGITANIDSVIGVARLEQKDGSAILDNDKRAIREISMIKLKDGEDGRRWRFVLPSIEIGQDQDGDPITSCVVRGPNDEGAPGAQESPKEAGKRLSPQAELFVRAIRKAIDDQGEEAPSFLHLPAGHRVVQWKHVLSAFGRLGFAGEGEGDPKKRQAALYTAAKRHGEALMADRIIMRESPFVWFTGRKVRGINTRTGAERPADEQSIDDRPGDFLSTDEGISL